jgi:arylsulfatase A-like enzyme
MIPTGNRRQPISLIVLSAWCGLVAGLLEVGAIVMHKRFFDANQLYGLSRHFLWLIPLTNLAVFVVLGGFGCLVIWAWPSRGWWVFARALCALTMLPVFLVAFPRIYGLSWLFVAFGVAARLVPLVREHATLFRRVVQVSFPIVVATVAILAASPWVSDRSKQSRERARPLPPAGSSNVLLVVMDTVAADHLSLLGYARPTSTTLVELAERGIRFDSARAPSSWTLPSHASVFTGRWFHELSTGWITPLDGNHPTLAEFLGAHGYATAGFAANYTYCARDSGLARGFVHYQDFIFPQLTCFKVSTLVSRSLLGIQAVGDFLERDLGLSWFRPYLKYLWWLLDTNRKGAAVINRELVDWLDQRRQPERPFFAFLNYYDAHYPYQLTPGRMHRFGAMPGDNRQRDLIQNWSELDKSALSPQDIEFAVNAYDECIADLDEQLGVLFDELERRGILETTWLIIVADHGESFGEHAGVFCHGTSLYQTEVHVPLLIIPPGGAAARKVVTETVSLRDLAATMVDVLAMAPESPFPGESLARLWKVNRPEKGGDDVSTGHALAEVVPLDPHKLDPSGLPEKTSPLGGLADGEWSYVRSEGDLREELFHLRNDAKEQRNLVGDPAAGPSLERMRERLKKLTGGRLTPERFNP